MASEKVLRASSAYNWRNKLVTMTMELHRRMRNSSRQLTLRARAAIVSRFIHKLRISGYSLSTVKGVIDSGVTFYYRKMRIYLQGGPRINCRHEMSSQEVVQHRRQKLGVTQTWFSRRRGGQTEVARKVNRWRFEECCDKPGPGSCHRRMPMKSVPGSHPVPGRPNLEAVGPPKVEEQEKKTVSTLLVPFSVDSALMKSVQRAEDSFTDLMGGSRVRVLEHGGDTLINSLGRNDPWAARRRCPDEGCMTCESRFWLQAQKKKARKLKLKLPEVLLTETSNLCRREGCNYSIQCLDCIPKGLRTLYHGESSRSPRQRHGEHKRDLEHGITSSPLVVHALEEHGGMRPKFLAVVRNTEPRALYRIVRESVMIGGQPFGPQNMNRCQEWGVPRVPVLSSLGGDKVLDYPVTGSDNMYQALGPKWRWWRR